MTNLTVISTVTLVENAVTERCEVRGVIVGLEILRTAGLCCTSSRSTKLTRTQAMDICFLPTAVTAAKFKES